MPIHPSYGTHIKSIKTKWIIGHWPLVLPFAWQPLTNSNFFFKQNSGHFAQQCLNWWAPKSASGDTKIRYVICLFQPNPSMSPSHALFLFSVDPPAFGGVDQSAWWTKICLYPSKADGSKVDLRLLARARPSAYQSYHNSKVVWVENVGVVCVWLLLASSESVLKACAHYERKIHLLFLTHWFQENHRLLFITVFDFLKFLLRSKLL